MHDNKLSSFNLGSTQENRYDAYYFMTCDKSSMCRHVIVIQDDTVLSDRSS